jgi:hypothetical protein
MKFKEWLEARGCNVEVTQEKGNEIYYCLEVTMMDGERVELTVTEDA